MSLIADVFYDPPHMPKGTNSTEESNVLWEVFSRTRDHDSKHSNIKTVMYRSIYTDMLLLWLAYDPFQLYLA